MGRGVAGEVAGPEGEGGRQEMRGEGGQQWERAKGGAAELGALSLE